MEICAVSKTTIMKKNIGTGDRAVRIIAALLIAVLYFLQVISGTTAIVLLVIAGVLMLTALLGFCPLYRILGISSERKKEQEV